jgi:hypothetical protein
MKERKVKYKDNQVLAKIDLDEDTGELTDSMEIVKEHDDDRGNYENVKFKPNGLFQKQYTAAWMLLDSQTNDREFLVAVRLGMKARAFTNSLVPLGPDSTMNYLSKVLNVDRRYIGPIIDKLLKLGVIGVFKIAEPTTKTETMINNYWVFNPYLSFNGVAVNREVKTLFDNTFYAKIMQ